MERLPCPKAKGQHFDDRSELPHVMESLHFCLQHQLGHLFPEVIWKPKGLINYSINQLFTKILDVIIKKIEIFFFTLRLPYLAARCKGVNPFLVVAVNEALCSSKTEATSSWPFFKEL